jgi:PleD family two-component response regulator
MGGNDQQLPFTTPPSFEENRMNASMGVLNIEKGWRAFSRSLALIKLGRTKDGDWH